MPSREDRVIEAATTGALGGALAAYLGGGPLDPGGLADKLLLGAAIGAGVPLVFLVGFAVVARDRSVLWWLWWAVPGAALGALILGYRELLDWAFGWAVGAWASGWRAALVGGAVGAVVVGGIAFLRTRPRTPTPPIS